jgi:AMMECR1 domain-containing protein
LTSLVPVAGPEEIVIGRHGIVLSKGGRKSVFLPQVAPEQGWDRETTLTHLALKAGLGPDAWREGCEFLVFEADVF